MYTPMQFVTLPHSPQPHRKRHTRKRVLFAVVHIYEPLFACRWGRGGSIVVGSSTAKGADMSTTVRNAILWLGSVVATGTYGRFIPADTMASVATCALIALVALFIISVVPLRR